MYTIAIMAVVVIAVVVLVIVAVIVIVVAAALCENQKTAHQLFFLSAAHLKFANVAFGKLPVLLGQLPRPFGAYNFIIIKQRAQKQ